ncbi:MAG: hypothetical protein U0R26_11200 [Solirubrobacterales bacterium]
MPARSTARRRGSDWNVPPGLAEFARGFATLVHEGARDAFLQTMRSVIGPDGQRVSAMDRSTSPTRSRSC